MALKFPGKPSNYYAYVRSLAWKQTRLDYLRRTGWRCENYHCVRKAYVVHHLNYDRIGHEQPEDLQALCWECHERMHRWPKAANDNQLQLPLDKKKTG